MHKGTLRYINGDMAANLYSYNIQHFIISNYSYSPAPLAPVDVGDAHLRHHSIQRAATGEPQLWLISFAIKRDANCTCTYHRLHTEQWKAFASYLFSIK